MAFYHHEADFNHYPTTTPAAARLDAFSNQSLPAAYRFSGLAHDIPADRWGMAAQQGPAFGSQPGLPGGAGFESVDEATSYNRWSDGPSQPSYANHCWPAQSQQPYLGQAGSSDWGTFPARSTMAPGPSSVIPTPSNVPLHHWEANQSGLSASTFDWNVHPTNQSMSCPSRTGQSSTRRFQPYGTSRAREPEQWNAEAGPSTVTLPQTPYVGSPTPEPTGGFIPETTADAENDQHITEEEEAPRCKRTRLPNGEGVPRNGRKREQGDFHILCAFVRVWKNLTTTPTNAEALTAAYQYIKTVRPKVYVFPRLKLGKTGPCPEHNKRAKNEWDRRNLERTMAGKLSRYYRVPGDNMAVVPQEEEMVWMRPALIKEVLLDLEVRYPPLELFNPPGPLASTLTAAAS